MDIFLCLHSAIWIKNTVCMKFAWFARYCGHWTLDICLVSYTFCLIDALFKISLSRSPAKCKTQNDLNMTCGLVFRPKPWFRQIISVVCKCIQWVKLFGLHELWMRWLLTDRVRTVSVLGRGHWTVDLQTNLRKDWSFTITVSRRDIGTPTQRS